MCLGVGLPSGTNDHMFLFCLKIASFFLCGAPSPTRGWVCNLLVQLLLGLARAVTLGPKSRRTDDHILSHLRLPQPGRPSLRIYIPQEQGGPDTPPGTGFPFCRLLGLAGLRWKNCSPPPHRTPSQRHATTDGESVSMSWCRAPSGSRDQMFVTVWRLLSCLCGAPFLARRRVCLLPVRVCSI
jgi:hypothetical protein